MTFDNCFKDDCAYGFLDKERVASGFDKAAQSYEKHSYIQQQVGRDAINKLKELMLLNRTDHENLKQDYLLDIGCGPAPDAQHLSELCQHLVGVDIATAMLAEARQKTMLVEARQKTMLAEARQKTMLAEARKQSSEAPSISFANCDAEQLAIQSKSTDIVYSSMALQWCVSPQVALSEIYRVLKPNGRALLAIMVGESFEQLHNAFSCINKPSRVNRFHMAQQWLHASSTLQWSYVHEIKSYTSYHSSALTMLKSLKQIGANTYLSGQISSATNNLYSNTPSLKTTGYLSKQELKQLDKYLNAYRTEFFDYPLEYKVLYLSIKK